MVSKRQLRGRGGFSLKLAAFVLALQVLACSRHAEIEDAPEDTVPVTEVPKPAGGVPVVEDAPLDNAERLSCAERPVQAACQGVNDFPCNFDGWLRQLAQACQTQTDCHTDGWIEVAVDTDGCASELRMEDPDPPYVACITEQLSQYQCPCTDVVGSHFLGLAHDGCIDASCGTGELRCAPGSHCQSDQCVEDAAAGGAGGMGG
jgi:hypothetical protein